MASPPPPRRRPPHPQSDPLRSRVTGGTGAALGSAAGGGARPLASGLIAGMYAARGAALGARLRDLTGVEPMLDGERDSLVRLEAVLARHPDLLAAVGDLPVGIGSYLGQMIIAHLDGWWAAGDGTLCGVGRKRVQINPVLTARRRLHEGVEHHLYLWFETVVRAAGGRAR